MTMSNGLQSIELTTPAWIGEWREEYESQWIRWLVSQDSTTRNPTVAPFGVWQRASGEWRHTCPSGASDQHPSEGYKTCEASQAACEAAIIAAWRNR